VGALQLRSGVRLNLVLQIARFDSHAARSMAGSIADQVDAIDNPQRAARHARDVAK
jgi:hypothetical protein